MNTRIRIESAVPPIGRSLDVLHTFLADAGFVDPRNQKHFALARTALEHLSALMKHGDLETWDEALLLEMLSGVEQGIFLMAGVLPDERVQVARYCLLAIRNQIARGSSLVSRVESCFTV